MKRLFACLALVLGLLAMWNAAAPPAAAEDPVVARLNGMDIYRTEALRARGRLPATMQHMSDDQVLPALVDIIIDSRLLADEARTQGLAYEPQVRAQINLVTDLVLEQVLLSRYMRDRITDEAVRAMYDEVVANEKARDQVHARHILVENEESARDLIAELDAGADFVALADKYSTDATGNNGGDLGFFSRGDMVAPFAEAAFALNVGEYTKEPVETKFGWHVIKVVDRRIAKVRPYEQVKKALERELANELRNEYVGKLRESADIEVIDR